MSVSEATSTMIKCSFDRDWEYLARIICEDKRTVESRNARYCCLCLSLIALQACLASCYSHDTR